MNQIYKSKDYFPSKPEMRKLEREYIQGRLRKMIRVSLPSPMAWFRRKKSIRLEKKTRKDRNMTRCPLRCDSCGLTIDCGFSFVGGWFSIQTRVHYFYWEKSKGCLLSQNDKNFGFVFPWSKRWEVTLSTRYGNLNIWFN